MRKVIIVPMTIMALTLVCTPGKSGRYTTFGTNYEDNGDIVTSKSSGTFESSGIHRWRTRADVTRSDGRTFSTEGEVELAARSWKGKAFEK
jgi:hypothetical protein